MNQTPNNFAELIDIFIGFINLLIPLLFALTLAMVIWKVVQAWIINGGDPSSVEAGKRTVFVAVIALTAMASIWGLVNLLQSSIGLN